MQKQSKCLKVKFKMMVGLVQSSFSQVAYSVPVSELLLEHSVIYGGQTVGRLRSQQDITGVPEYNLGFEESVEITCGREFGILGLAPSEHATDFILNVT